MGRTRLGVALWIIGMLAGLLAWPASARASIALDVRGLEATAGPVDPARVLDGEFDEAFRTALGTPMRVDPVDGEVWLRITPTARAFDGGHVLALTRSPLRGLDVWVPDRDGGFRLYAMSFFRPSGEPRDLHAFRFDLPALERPRPVYVRVLISGRLYFDAQVMPAAEYERTALVYLALFLLVQGMLMAVVAGNLVIGLRLREPATLAYAVLVAVQMGWALFASGFAYQWAWVADGPLGAVSPVGALSALSTALLLVFVHRYLRLPRREAIARGLLLAMGLLFAGFAVAYLVPGGPAQPAVWQGSRLAGVVVPVVVAWALWRAWRGGDTGAAWLALAWAPLALANLVRSATTFGLLDPGPAALWGPLVTLPLTSLVLGIAMVGRAMAFQREHRQVRALAERDPLTGVANRRAGERALEQAFSDCRERGAPLSLAFLDVDYLKRVNDGIGHDAGDALLRAVATRLRALVGGQGEVARWGGDEFVILLPGVPAREAEAMAEGWARMLSATPVVFAGESIPLSASLGVTGMQQHDLDSHALVHRADQHLLERKRARPKA
jgi:diguanylate cyclase (GGDEF)-like protein